MSLETSLQRLTKKVTPSDAFADTVKSRLMRRIGAEEITASALALRPTKAFHHTVKQRILHAVQPPIVESLLSLVSRTQPVSHRKPSLRHHVMPQSPRIHSWIKWSAAFALFLLIIRSMPLILLAPSTLAETSVQVLPAGDDVTMFIGGVWQNITEPQVLNGSAMISTGASRATIVLNGGVFRLNPDTTLKIHALSIGDVGPTATLVGNGQVWALGLLPPGVDGLALETDAGTLQLNAGSASVYQNGSKVSVAVYDKGVTFSHDGQPMFLVSGEKTSFINGKSTSITTMPVSVFADPSVADNLSQDAVHRAQIAALQQERRIEMAGILPTSVLLYKAKRVAEQVDVLFTLTDDGKTAKHLEQANTRLSEALALWKSGYHDEAQVPLAEYSDSLVALASDAQSNIVQDLIKQQIVDASTTLTSSDDDDAQKNIAFLHDAVQRVDAAIPNADLSSLDIQGYVLVGELSDISKLLSVDHNPEAAATMYVNIRPYLTSLLSSDSGIHPLLQREANVHLVSIATHLQDAKETGKDSDIIAAMEKDLVAYLPSDRATIEELNSVADAYAQQALVRILNLDLYSSRYNELFREMDTIISDRNNPNRGLYLRKLKAVLPADLQDYVNVGIKRLGDELQR